MKLSYEILKTLLDLHSVDLVFITLLLRAKVVAEKYPGVVESCVHLCFVHVVQKAGSFSREGVKSRLHSCV